MAVIEEIGASTVVMPGWVRDELNDLLMSWVEFGDIDLDYRRLSDGRVRIEITLDDEEPGEDD